MPKQPKDFNIITMVCDPEWLGDADIQPPQLAVLKAIYGLEMTPEEMDAYLAMTEGRKPVKGGYFESTLCVGVRSGKTEKIGSNVALYQAITFDRTKANLAPGEVPYIGIVAQDKRGAAQNFGYIEGKARLLEERGWEILDHGSAQERAVTGNEIRFRSSVVAEVFPAKKAATRNKTMIMGLVDELAWWETEELKVNADYEICRALKQRMTTVRPWSKFVKLSSPYLEHGVLHDDYENRTTARRMFVHAPSWVFNPNMDPTVLAEARADDPEGFLRDFGAQFGKAGGAYYTGGEIDASMRDDRPYVMQPQEGRDYRAWIDAAFTKDLFAVAVGYREGDEVVYPLVHWWIPTKHEPLNDRVVAKELADLVKPYRVDRLNADAHAAVPFANDLIGYGLTLNVQTMTNSDSYAMHKNFKAAMRRGLINLPKDDMIRADVLSCRKLGSGNSIKIAAPNRKGFHDDITKVIAAVALELMPIGASADLEALNAGAIGDRDRLFKQRGFPLPDREDRLPSNFMGERF